MDKALVDNDPSVANLSLVENGEDATRLIMRFGKCVSQQLVNHGCAPSGLPIVDFE
jgi:hypothetical protein